MGGKRSAHTLGWNPESGSWQDPRQPRILNVTAVRLGTGVPSPTPRGANVATTYTTDADGDD